MTSHTSTEVDVNDLTNQIVDTKTAAQELLDIAQQTHSDYVDGTRITKRKATLILKHRESHLFMRVFHYPGIVSVLSKLNELLCKVGVSCGGCFEWVDSLLVQAIKEGHWMLLSHANFCR